MRGVGTYKEGGSFLPQSFQLFFNMVTFQAYTLCPTMLKYFDIFSVEVHILAFIRNASAACMTSSSKQKWLPLSLFFFLSWGTGSSHLMPNQAK